MKLILYISAICVLMSPLYIASSLLSWKKYKVKKEVKHKIIAGLDKNELVRLEFSFQEVEKELRWEHSKEFEYKGEMYDVVERQRTDSSLVFWCWWDHEETLLNKKLERWAQNVFQNDPFTGQQQRQIISWQLGFYHDFIDFQMEANFVIKQEKPLGYLLGDYQIDPTSETPPPIY